MLRISLCLAVTLALAAPDIAPSKCPTSDPPTRGSNPTGCGPLRSRPGSSRRTARLAATLVISTAPSTTMSIRLSTSGSRFSADLRGLAAALSWFGA